MVIPSFLLFAASIFAIPSALAAFCFPNPSTGFSAEQFQVVADRVCGEGPTYEQQFGTSGYPYDYRMMIYGNYSGTVKLQCKDAFANIISQCVEGQGVNGGLWDYSYYNDQETYYLQALVG
ncbi:hypothetical protein V8E54_000095 [Elaphomyces granulatus]